MLAAVLETAAQPVSVVNREAVLRFANPAAITALGSDSADELTVEGPMLLPRSTGEAATGDLDWFFRRDGSMFAVSDASAPIEMSEGRSVVVAFTDIQDR